MTVADAEQISTRLSALLEERYPGKPRRRICEETGVSYKTLSDALTGKTIPRYGTIERLAAYLGVSPGYIYNGEDDEPILSEEDRLRVIEQQIGELTRTIENLSERIARENP